MRQKRKPNSAKILNFDTLKCGNCASYVMVLWSTSELLPHDPLHDFVVVPWPNRIEEHPDHWPEEVGGSGFRLTGRYRMKTGMRQPSWLGVHFKRPYGTRARVAAASAARLMIWLKGESCRRT
jgi:hypothetical protein